MHMRYSFIGPSVNYFQQFSNNPRKRLKYFYTISFNNLIYTYEIINKQFC